MPPDSTLYLIDASSYIYRAFYGVRGLATSTGMPTNAVFGFLTMLRRLLREAEVRYAAAVFDAPGPTLRHELSPEYKATRQEMPEALAVQIPLIKRAIAASGIAMLEVPGYEADDIIATLVDHCRQEGKNAVIISGDKDLLQLVGPGVVMWDTMKNETFGPEEVERRYGVPPAQLVEIFGLAGDSSDNIPGVPGVGPKTASKLIARFGSIDNLLRQLPQVDNDRLRQKLRGHADQARLSRQLVELYRQVPIDIDWESLRVQSPDVQDLTTLFQQLQFTKFLEEIQGRPDQVAAPDRPKYPEISGSDLERWLPADLAGTSLTVLAWPHPAHGRLLAITLAWAPGKAACLTLETEDFEAVLTPLRPLLATPEIAKTSHAAKQLLLLLLPFGLELRGLEFDTELAAQLLEPAGRPPSIAQLARDHLGCQAEGLEPYAHPREGKGEAATQEDLDPQAAAAAADYCGRLAPVLRAKLEEQGMLPLYTDIEMPLVSVLAAMEAHGVLVDQDALRELAASLEERLQASRAHIFAMAGTEFNLNSPQQLAAVLFDRLGLPPGKKTKSGFSTDAEVLAGLASLHPLPAAVLEYRRLLKLKSTYVDALPRLINPESGRIHTSYQQLGTVTGRLSSSEPNLQNIPVRSEEGRALRRAFIAPPGHLVLCADYSQIELRLLAHYSGDQALLAAFAAGEDIHRRTAAEIFGVPPEQVTPELRRRAKTINFGIIYGMSPYGLARQLGIAPREAKILIDQYFTRYQGVRQYIDQVVAAARQQGYVTTICNRRRVLPDISSRNRTAREFAERTAINTPIQGSAADLIKMAMVDIHRALSRQQLPAAMIIQVHDELVFEVRAEAAATVCDLVKATMEGIYPLSVPLVVKTGIGANWDAAH